MELTIQELIEAYETGLRVGHSEAHHEESLGRGEQPPVFSVRASGFEGLEDLLWGGKPDQPEIHMHREPKPSAELCAEGMHGGVDGGACPCGKLKSDRSQVEEAIEIIAQLRSVGDPKIDAFVDAAMGLMESIKDAGK